MKKVLVTGAAGRVGANVCMRLSEEGALVRAMVLPGDPLAGRLKGLKNVEIVEADLTNQESVTAAVDGVTHIIHLAVQMIRGNTPFDQFYEINAFGTLRLLLAAAQMGNIERFVLASTDGTYRPGDINRENPIKETSPQLPADHYGTGKYVGEVLLRNICYQYDIPWSIIRFATVISPEESLRFYRYGYMKFILDLENKGRDSHLWPLFEAAPGMAGILTKNVPEKDDPGVNLTGPKGPWTLHVADVRDITQGVMLAYGHPKALGEDFLIAGPQTTAYDEATRILKKHLGIPVYNVEMPVTWNLDMDITKAKTVLGYDPQWPYEKMLLAGIDALENGPKGFIPVR